jgi:AcrR family transcriptional regulator
VTKSARKKPAFRPGRLSAADAAALPARLLDAGLAVLNREGYSGATMEMVARQAGASTKTLYSRHANKEALALAVVSRMVDENLALAAPPPGAAPLEPYGFLTHMGEQVLDRIRGDSAGLVRIAFAEGRRSPELVRMHDLVMFRVTGFIAPLLARWKDEGLLPYLDDVQTTARFWVSMLTDMIRIRIAMGQPVSEDDAKAHVALAASIFLRGLGYKLPS